MTQIEYLEILFSDLEFSRQQRNAFCSSRVDREIKFLDELTKMEKSLLIDELKELKYGKI